MIKAVIFDMDGLLIDTRQIWIEAEQMVLAKRGIGITEEYIMSKAGLRTMDEVKAWRKDFGLVGDTDEEMVYEVENAGKEMIQRSGAPLPGVVACIEELHAHGILMAVASSSTLMLIEAVLDKLAIREYMQTLHSCEDEAQGKPAPDVFLSAARALGIVPQDCLVFEDSLAGIKAAKAAGMQCIAVPEKSYDRVEFEAAGPDMIVASLADVPWKTVQGI